MRSYPVAIDNLIENLKKIPGVGGKSAERMAFFLIYSPAEYLDEFAFNLSNLQKKLSQCLKCFSFTENKEICDICTSSFREKETICVVESFKDQMIFEDMGDYSGLYHILQGKLAPLDGVTPEKLKIKELIQRVENENIKEVIMATSLDLEGDSTAYYISKLLGGHHVKVTRLAKGLPFGSELEYVDLMSLSNSLKNREVLS